MKDFNVDEPMSRRAEEAVACVTALTAKPGKLEELIELQLVHCRRAMTMGGGIDRVRLYRAIDDTNMVALASLDDDRARSTESDIFIEHLNEIGPLIERALVVIINWSTRRAPSTQTRRRRILAPSSG
jgi:hypothetical protein